jgi:hypothetical protein
MNASGHNLLYQGGTPIAHHGVQNPGIWIRDQRCRIGGLTLAYPPENTPTFDCCFGRFQLLDDEEGVEERLGNYARW